jgi:hypothetical protein
LIRSYTVLCTDPAVERRIRQLAETHPRQARVLAAVALAGAAVLVLARTNPMHLTFLQDHPLSANEAFVPATLLMCLALALLSWSGGRRRLVPALVSVAVLVLFCGGGLALESPDAFVRRGHDLAGDAYTADGRYELRIFSWQSGTGPFAWDVRVERRGAVRFVAVDAGCFSASVTIYRGIESFEPGHARLITGSGLVDVRFDTQSMHVTAPVPAELCPND